MIATHPFPFSPPDICLKSLPPQKYNHVMFTLLLVYSTVIMDHTNNVPLSSHTASPTGILQKAQGLGVKPYVNRACSVKANEDILVLPEPTFRDVPADVRRRKDNIVNAEPPPPPRRQQARKHSSGQKQTSSRQIRRLDNSESESDSDNKNKYSPSRTDGVRQAKPVEEVDDQEFSRESLEAEEQKRVEQLRRLRIVQERWDTGYRLRRQRNHAEVQERMRRLFHESTDYSLPSPGSLQTRNKKKLPRSHQPSAPPDKDDLEETQARFREHLDATLSRGLEIDIWTGKNDNRSRSLVAEYLDAVIIQVEKGVIFRLNQFSDLGWGTMPPPHVLWLMRSIRALHRAYWRFVKSQDTSSPRGIRQAFDRFTTSRNVLNDSLDAGESQPYGSIDMVVEVYLRKVLESLHSAISTDLGKQLDEADDQSPALYELLESSRPDGELSDNYKQWVCQGISPVIEKCCEKCRNDVRHDIAVEFRRTMDAMRMEVRQEFIPADSQGGFLLLVLFKDNYASTISEVSDEDAANIGWFHHSDKEGLCRWSIVEDLCDTGAYLINLEGEVLGLQTWTGYYIEFQALLHGYSMAHSGMN